MFPSPLPFFRRKLDSGDVFIFGGKNRFVSHSVKKVYANTAPEFLNLKKKARFNLTFRCCESVYGRENEFARVEYKPKYQKKRKIEDEKQTKLEKFFKKKEKKEKKEN